MKLEKIQLNSIVIQNKDIDATDLNGEKVMMNLDKGKYYALNPVGSRIWEIVHEPITVKSIIDILLQEYDVDYKMCEENVLMFLGRLKDDELICIN